jgi:heat shock protein HtpX
MAAALGLTTYRWNNNIKSFLLLAAFPFLLLLLLGLIFFFIGLLQSGPSGRIDPYAYQSFGLAMPLAGGTPLDLARAAIWGYWPIVLGVAAIWLLIGYFFNDGMIHAATGAQPVTREEAPRLYTILETLCISRGIKTPTLYIIETDAMNAYASGIDQRTFSVTVTSGLLARLNDSELEAVLAHELTHILQRDVRLLIVTIVFVGMISFMAQILWRTLQVFSFTRSRGRDGGAGIVILLIAAVVFAIGYLLALILRFAISRKREYLADAGSVELTKNPEALISALRKIADNPEVPHVSSEAKQMFIENPPGVADFFGLFSTHPPIESRIHVLEELGGLPSREKSAIPSGGGSLPEDDGAPHDRGSIIPPSGDGPA